jgi:hypothetical protein
MTTVKIEVDDDLFDRASHLAAARRMSVSEMLERLLRVVAEPPLKRSDLPSLTSQAVGILPSMTDEQVKKVLEDAKTLKFGTS